MTLAHKKKGQASAEYITLVAGGALFVLIVIVAVNGFFNAPAKQTVIEQGALVQTQVGSLSGAATTGNPITIRTPKQYNGLTAFPVTFTFQVNECLTKAELYTDYPDAYQLRETLLEADLPVGGLATFQYQIDQETPFTYDILVTPCEGAEFRTPQLDLSATDPQAPAYQEALQNDLQAGAPVGTPTKPTVTLKGEYYVGQACNAGTCTYTFDFTYNLNKNVQTAQLQFLDSNNQPANIAQGNANSIAVNAKTAGENTFRTTVTARDPTFPGAAPTLNEYKWQLNACTVPAICATSPDSNAFNFNLPTPGFTLTLGQNANGILNLPCETRMAANDVLEPWCSGTATFNLQQQPPNPLAKYQATLILINQTTGYEIQIPLTSPVNGVPEGESNKNFEHGTTGNFDAWNIKTCKQGTCTQSPFPGKTNRIQIQSPTIQLGNVDLQQINCNHGNCMYTATFSYTPNGEQLDTSKLQITDPDGIPADILFENFNPCGGAFTNEYQTTPVNPAQPNTIQRCLIAKDPINGDAFGPNPLQTIQNYNWTTTICNTYNQCTTPTSASVLQLSFSVALGQDITTFTQCLGGGCIYDTTLLFTPTGNTVTSIKAKAFDLNGAPANIFWVNGAATNEQQINPFQIGQENQFSTGLLIPNPNDGSQSVTWPQKYMWDIEVCDQSNVCTLANGHQPFN